MLEAGRQVGAYCIEDTIKIGGMAVVYRARHRLLESLHAVKVLNPQLCASPELRQRFLGEGRIQARLRHPHITPVTDVISEPGVAALVMPFLQGRDLADTLAADGPTPLPLALAWIHDVLDTLTFVHDQGIVHRDLKPGNLFLEQLPDGRRQVMVMDFGIAQIRDRRLTRTQVQMGSLGYMAPEQLQGARDADARADLFAVGAVLYELLAARPAFEGDTDWLLMRNIMEGSVRPLHHHRPDLPDWLCTAVHTALAHDPDARFPDARAMAQALTAPPPPPPPPVPAPAPTATMPAPYPGQIRYFQGMPMAWIPAGSFEMGSPDRDPDAQRDEKPLRTVPIPQPLWVCTTPITQKQWADVAGSNPAHFARGGRLPVEQVSWCDAVVFANRLSQQEGLTPAYQLPPGFVLGMDSETCARLHARVAWDRAASGYRLPTEAEWEYAARAGTTTRFWSGDTEADLARVGWYTANAESRTHPAGAHDAPNPWGLHDIHGNVWEWCFDATTPNNTDPREVPSAVGASRVLRGGSWNDAPAWCRAAFRVVAEPGSRWVVLGLRLVRPALPA